MGFFDFGFTTELSGYGPQDGMDMYGMNGMVPSQRQRGTNNMYPGNYPNQGYYPNQSPMQGYGMQMPQQRMGMPNQGMSGVPMQQMPMMPNPPQAPSVPGGGGILSLILNRKYREEQAKFMAEQRAYQAEYFELLREKEEKEMALETRSKELEIREQELALKEKEMKLAQSQDMHEMDLQEREQRMTEESTLRQERQSFDEEKMRHNDEMAKLQQTYAAEMEDLQEKLRSHTVIESKLSEAEADKARLLADMQRQFDDFKKGQDEEKSAMQSALEKCQQTIKELCDDNVDLRNSYTDALVALEKLQDKYYEDITNLRNGIKSYQKALLFANMKLKDNGLLNDADVDDQNSLMKEFPGEMTEADKAEIDSQADTLGSLLEKQQKFETTAEPATQASQTIDDIIQAVQYRQEDTVSAGRDKIQFSEEDQALIQQAKDEGVIPLTEEELIPDGGVVPVTHDEYIRVVEDIKTSEEMTPEEKAETIHKLGNTPVGFTDPAPEGFEEQVTETIAETATDAYDKIAQSKGTTVEKIFAMMNLEMAGSQDDFKENGMANALRGYVTKKKEERAQKKAEQEAQKKVEQEAQAQAQSQVREQSVTNQSAQSNEVGPMLDGNAVEVGPMLDGNAVETVEKPIPAVEPVKQSVVKQSPSEVGPMLDGNAIDVMPDKKEPVQVAATTEQNIEHSGKEITSNYQAGEAHNLELDSKSSTLDSDTFDILGFKNKGKQEAETSIQNNISTQNNTTAQESAGTQSGTGVLNSAVRE